MKKKHPLLKPVLITVIAIVAVILLAVGIYALYVCLEYDRIPDNLVQPVANNPKEILQPDTEYTAVTYNIGFGAYGQDFSFFMDSGTMTDGTEVRGSSGKAQSKDHVLFHTQGAIEVLASLDADFLLIQEVDDQSTRSYQVNQVQAIEETFPAFGSVFTRNFHSAWLFYPFHDPHGRANSGLMTLSRYHIEESVRRSYPVDEGFPQRFFDLDRCFSLNRIPVANGKELVLINSHMSAYDEGGLIRVQQLKMLNDIASQEHDKGNYVIIGGDFNHALGEIAATAFASDQLFPQWVFILTSEDLDNDLHIVTADNETSVSTCRTADIPYEQGINFTTNVDGFIVSSNVKARAMNIETDYEFSDHQPVKLWFELL